MKSAQANTVAKIAAIVAGLGLVAMAFASFAPQIKADAFSFGKNNYVSAGTGTLVTAGAVEATTSPVFLRTTDTATSSITAFVGDSGSVHVFLQFNASSSVSVLNELRYFSDNGIDWYGENLETVTTNILVANSSTTPTRTWQPSLAGTSRKTEVINTNSKYVKIDYSVTGANGSLWAVAVPKQETPN